MSLAKTVQTFQYINVMIRQIYYISLDSMSQQPTIHFILFHVQLVAINLYESSENTWLYSWWQSRGKVMSSQTQVVILKYILSCNIPYIMFSMKWVVDLISEINDILWLTTYKCTLIIKQYNIILGSLTYQTINHTK